MFVLDRLRERLRSISMRTAGSLLLLLSLAIGAEVRAGVEWKTLAPGMELGTAVAKKASRHGDSKITILRIDPDRWDLELLAISETGEKSGRTARGWSEKHGLTAAINAGMFATDYSTHVGYLRAGNHVNNGRFNKYESVAAFGPKKSGIPRFRIFDLDAPGTKSEAIVGDYSSVVQNLRLIKRPGENRWSRQEKAWSEAALGEDSSGRILFVFCRSPYSMYDLNHELLALDVDLVAAQHLEGGPEAQIYVKAGDVEIEMFGSFETSFQENDANSLAWPIPNVLGVRPRAAAGGE